MKWLNEKTILLEKELNELDKLLLSFVGILEKYFEYVVVSCYVSILFGRSRATEDIDVLVKEINEKKFSEFWKEINKSFWCLNAKTLKEALSLVKESSLRFARKNEIIPNIELKTCRERIDFLTIDEKIKVVLVNKKSIFISPIELQIAYKEEVLKSEKDLEDALYLREIFKEKVDNRKIEEFRKVIKSGEKRVY
jgi:predicted nucleotidyltransferase